MNLSELFIRRPVMTVLLNLGILMAGILGYRSIPWVIARYRFLPCPATTRL